MPARLRKIDVVIDHDGAASGPKPRARKLALIMTPPPIRHLPEERADRHAEIAHDRSAAMSFIARDLRATDLKRAEDAA